MAVKLESVVKKRETVMIMMKEGVVMMSMVTKERRVKVVGIVMEGGAVVVKTLRTMFVVSTLDWLAKVLMTMVQLVVMIMMSSHSSVRIRMVVQLSMAIKMVWRLVEVGDDGWCGGPSKFPPLRHECSCAPCRPAVALFHHRQSIHPSIFYL